MNKPKLLVVALVTIALLVSQVGIVFAAPPAQEGFITGTVTALKCKQDKLGNNIYRVTVEAANGASKTVRIDQATAEELGLVAVGNLDCDNNALKAAVGMEVSIDPATVITDPESPTNPVANALAGFFSDLTDYDTLMAAHEDGTGFGVIAQALWLTEKMGGDAEVLSAILEAKKTGDYSAFTLEDGTVVTNWGQFKKALLAGDKKDNLGMVMKNKDKSNHGNGQDKNDNNPPGLDKDKPDKDKNK